jgi:hypothetical protein
MTFKQTNLFPKYRNLAGQHTTEKSEANKALEANRPNGAPYRKAHRVGWLTQRVMNFVRHDTDVENSIAKRIDPTLDP